MRAVDLSEKMKEQEDAAKQASVLAMRKKMALKRPVRPTQNRADEIDEIYGDKETDMVDKQLQKINRPRKTSQEEKGYKKIAYILFFIIIIGAFYFYFNRNSSPSLTLQNEVVTSGWYAVKLTNGEIYYGEVANTSADPVIVKNVYYNYDQLNAGNVEQPVKAEGGNIRLVKRGKETHGPDGTMEIVRSQVELFERLDAESKVLKAILEYEK